MKMLTISEISSPKPLWSLLIVSKACNHKSLSAAFFSTSPWIPLIWLRSSLHWPLLKKPQKKIFFAHQNPHQKAFFSAYTILKKKSPKKRHFFWKFLGKNFIFYISRLKRPMVAAIPSDWLTLNLQVGKPIAPQPIIAVKELWEKVCKIWPFSA